MDKIAFSSSDLPGELTDEVRFERWREIFRENFLSLDLSRKHDVPFSMRWEATRFDSVWLTRIDGAVKELKRTPGDVAENANDDFVLALNVGTTTMSFRQRNKEGVLECGSATLVTNAEAGAIQADGGTLFTLSIPRHRLLDAVSGADELVTQPIAPEQAPLAYLRRYIEMLQMPDGAADDPTIARHVETTLVDLVTLCVGAGRETLELARSRGVRAARLKEVLAGIKSGFDDPGFSAAAIAAKLGVSPRTVQDLLQESGASFTERVLELRLQKASAMLRSPKHDRSKIIDIAFACGFSDISYFNQCFRRRFNASPSEVRGR